MPPYEQLLAENGSLREENTVLKAQLAWLRKQFFGTGKSEKLDRAQLLLKLEALQEHAAALEAKSETITYERTKRAGSKRRLPAEAFAALPVQETVEIIPAQVQAQPRRSTHRRGAHLRGGYQTTPPQDPADGATRRRRLYPVLELKERLQLLRPPRAMHTPFGDDQRQPPCAAGCDGVDDCVVADSPSPRRQIAPSACSRSCG